MSSVVFPTCQVSNTCHVRKEKLNFLMIPQPETITGHIPLNFNVLCHVYNMSKLTRQYIYNVMSCERGDQELPLPPPIPTKGCGII